MIWGVTSMFDYRNRRGESITFRQWCGLQSVRDYVVVLRTELPRGIVLVTFWMGWTPDTFSSVVFNPDNPISPLGFRCAPNESAARDNHAELAAEWGAQ